MNQPAEKPVIGAVNEVMWPMGGSSDKSDEPVLTPSEEKKFIEVNYCDAVWKMIHFRLFNLKNVSVKTIRCGV